MGIRFETKDPRGYKVNCTDEIWNNKILVKRPWMTGWEAKVKETIEKPDLPIFSDANHKDRVAYYKKIKGYNRGRYLKVVVKFNQRNIGFLITAQPTSSGKKGEYPI